MDNIWSPWRMEFIRDQRQKEGGAPCVFCELEGQQPNDQNLVLFLGQHNYIVMNRFPYTNGHLLIIPYGHCAHLKESSKEVYQEILDLMVKSMEVLKEVLEAQGFNCGLNVGRVSGCGIVDHYHWHVVPRWNGDTNFMPVLGGARVMPEYLSETYGRLRPGFARLR